MTLADQHPLGSGFTVSSTAADVLADRDLTGQTAVVTGGSSGLGLETSRALARAGARVIVPVRSEEVARGPLSGIDDVVLVDGVDLADLGGIADAAERINSVTDRVDMLIAAAGVMATPPRPVGPGWDYQLAVNHLGHFALTARLFPLLARTGARVVVYSSAGHHASDIRWDDPHFLTGYDRWAAYGQSKTANVLFAVWLDQLGTDHGVRAFALHPGKIITGLQRQSVAEQVELGWIDTDGNVVGSDFKTPSQGAATGVWAATSPLLDGLGGLYLEDCDIASVARDGGTMDEGGVRPYALDSSSAERLWQLTSALTATNLAQGERACRRGQAEALVSAPRRDAGSRA
ncbi:NAD(P)-dependent dehydrogenase, short-chain alcohol dehydrogenase family [Gordonia malaquae]|uniref:Probable oxidoreductase n=1 Tax=Gordonia malaquae NBRC 108250 TaxID=1223542 RepID=M3TH28_GORML|nr:oxidoreductase [Gordonia malaquae]GAC80746.1 putative oxidoreductase [Gordonia malaquae NBRC 108250]SED50029.1 NAD(P)-dependent dehydrogenase, short-chain alcohol dehydrogenase family [Gordonia malaquae]